MPSALDRDDIILGLRALIAELRGQFSPQFMGRRESLLRQSAELVLVLDQGVLLHATGQ